MICHQMNASIWLQMMDDYSRNFFFHFLSVQRIEFDEKSIDCSSDFMNKLDPQADCLLFIYLQLRPIKIKRNELLLFFISEKR